MRTTFTADKLWDGSRTLHDAMVIAEDGRIVSIESRAAGEATSGAVRDFGAATLAPAFFDVHIHGSAGHDVMEATPEALTKIGGFLASRGTGAYLATTVTAPLDATLKSLARLARLMEQKPNGPCAWPVGIHMEGPFLSHAKRGVHPPDLLLAPDIAVFDRMWEAAEGRVQMITLAPELPGAVELAAYVSAKGVRVSLGHSNATAAETRRVMDAGANTATHTFNAMRALDHREPGILGTVLTADELYADLICDGIHTVPEMVQLWWRAKGAQRGILITDAISAAGMPEGDYHLGGFAVQVANGRAIANGVLAGSVLTLDLALRNFLAFSGASLEDGLRLLTINPATMLQHSNEVGSLTPGGPANFVAVDENGRLLATVQNGEEAPR